MSKSIIYLTDRSAADTDDNCGMAFWWNRLQDGTGIVLPDENDALQTGKEIHDDLQRLAEAENPALTGSELAHQLCANVPAGSTSEVLEHAYRRAGWAVAFALFIEPTIRASWENVSTEGELILDRTPLWVPTTPDRVLRSRHNPSIYRYLEYKSSISASKKWLDSWRYAIQLHIGMAAVQEELGIKLAYSQIMALMKGDYRDGQLKHPYVWGYHNSNTGKWAHDYSQARGAAWSPRPVWEFPGGIVEWVKSCGEDVAKGQFPHTPPVMLNQGMLDKWVHRKKARMAQVGQVKDLCQTDLDARGIYFEQRTARCEPAFGFSCPYRLACWNATVNRDPLASGEYVRRIPHHEVEIQWRREHNGAMDNE